MNTEGTLSIEEFQACTGLYEQATGSYWLPIESRDQDVWIVAFEQAKKYFEGEKRD